MLGFQILFFGGLTLFSPPKSLVFQARRWSCHTCRCTNSQHTSVAYHQCYTIGDVVHVYQCQSSELCVDVNEVERRLHARRLATAAGDLRHYQVPHCDVFPYTCTCTPIGMMMSSDVFCYRSPLQSTCAIATLSDPFCSPSCTYSLHPSVLFSLSWNTDQAWLRVGSI